jgi:hypothetical protein
MFLENIDQPGWEGNRARSGGAFGEGFEAGLSAHFDDGADYVESPLIELERVGAETSRLTPAEACAARGSRDGAIPIGHDGEQDGYQLVASDDSFVIVVFASWRQPDLFKGLNAINRLRTAERRTAAVS